MDYGVLLLVIFGLVIFLALLKVFKKFVWALISFMLIIVIALIGLVGIIYTDYRYFSDTELVYVTLYDDEGALVVGLGMDVVKYQNNESYLLTEIDQNVLTGGEKSVNIALSLPAYTELSVENSVIDLNVDEDEQVSVPLSRETMIALLKSDEAFKEFYEILVENVEEIQELEDELGKNQAQLRLLETFTGEEVDEVGEEHDQAVKQYIFSRGLQNSFETGSVVKEVWRLYKEDAVQIIPEKTSLKILKKLPIEGLLPEDENNS